MAMAYGPGTSGASAQVSLDGCLEKISLRFTAVGLPKADTFGTTDPFISLYVMSGAKKILVGHTEVAMDNYSPSWHQHFVVDYNFEMISEYIVEVRHKHKQSPVNESPNHKLLGSFRFTNGALMMSQGQKVVARLQDGMKTGLVAVRGESVKDTRDIFKCHIMCNKLARKNGLGVFGKSDPYVQISREFSDGSYVVVYKTLHQLNNLNPIWKFQEISLLKLCNGDNDATLAIEVLDYNPNGSHVHIGACKTTVNQLLSGVTLELMERGRSKGMFYSNSGTIRFTDAQIERHPSLAEFIMGGMSMTLNVAIDFTASNGEPDTPKSLHRKPGPGMPPNDYEQAIRAVGDVIENYDREKKFAVYGFGARLRDENGNETPTQHCFPVYGGDSTVQGVEGVIGAYRDALNVVKLSGPTHFQPLIANAGYLAQTLGCSQESQHYTVLLILTDGIVDDMEATVAEIVRASALPLSVIIVGIGNEDFSEMEKLDGDDEKDRLAHGGVKSHRDIVQFVPFKKYSRKGPVALAQHVLAEIPRQVIAYMEEHQIMPMPPAKAPDNPEPDLPPGYSA